jgi:hypothetical protein
MSNTTDQTLGEVLSFLVTFAIIGLALVAFVGLH